MTEEAREAAARSFRHELEDNGGFTAGERAMLVMTYDRAWAEGVREGIRRAREAVAGDEPMRLARETGYRGGAVTPHFGISMALEAIDALEAEK